MTPGWKTSEFWLTVLTNLLSVFGALGGKIDPKTAGIISSAGNIVYTISRGIAKFGGPSTPPPAN